MSGTCRHCDHECHCSNGSKCSSCKCINCEHENALDKFHKDLGNPLKEEEK